MAIIGGEDVLRCEKCGGIEFIELKIVVPEANFTVKKFKETKDSAPIPTSNSKIVYRCFSCGEDLVR